MSTWQEALHAINTPRGTVDGSDRSLGWRPFWKRFPLTVTGLPGAGKTELFRRLTARNPGQGESSHADVAYARTTARNTAWAMRTIPGAPSTTRYRLTDRLFYGRKTRLYGLIYVVSFGYNTVWRDEYTVESQLGGDTLRDLRRFQLQKELEDLDLLQGSSLRRRGGLPISFSGRSGCWLLSTRPIYTGTI